MQTKQPPQGEVEQLDIDSEVVKAIKSAISEIVWLRKQLERAMRERNAYQARAKELRSALMSIASQHPVLKGRQK